MDVKFNWTGDSVTAALRRALGAANRDNAMHLAEEGAKQAPV